MEASSNDLYQLDYKLPVQEWQKEILDERERLIEEGKARFVDCEFVACEEAQKAYCQETS